MSDIRYKVVVEGLREAGRDALFAESALKKFGMTLQGMQSLRSKGLLESVPQVLSGGGASQSYIMQSNAFMQMGARKLLGMGSIVPNGPAATTLQSFFNQSMGIGAGQNRMTGSARAAYQSFWQNAVPPHIQPQSINWRQAGLGLAAAPFSPWIGARMLSNSLGAAFGGGGGGASKAIFGAGGSAMFAAFYVGLRTAGELLKLFAHNLSKAIEEGSRLYQRAAKTASSTGRLAHLDFMGAALGISPSEMETLLVRGEHPLKNSGAKYSPAGIDGTFGAGRGTAQIAVLQQMKNLSVEMRDAWIKTADTAREFANTAKALQATHQRITYVQSEWKTLWAQMSTLASPYLNVLNEVLRRYLRVTNMGLNQSIKGLQALHIIPKGDPGKNIIPTPRSASGGSAWERMGFVIGGFGGGHDYAKQTAQNTKKMVDLMHRAIPRGGSSGGSLVAAYNTP